MLELIVVTRKGSKLASVGKQSVLNVLALTQAGLIAVIAGCLAGACAADTVDVVDAEGLDVRIGLIASTGVDVDCVIGLRHAYVIGSCAAQ